MPSGLAYRMFPSRDQLAPRTSVARSRTIGVPPPTSIFLSPSSPASQYPTDRPSGEKKGVDTCPSVPRIGLASNSSRGRTNNWLLATYTIAEPSGATASTGCRPLVNPRSSGRTCVSRPVVPRGDGRRVHATLTATRAPSAAVTASHGHTPERDRRPATALRQDVAARIGDDLLNVNTRVTDSLIAVSDVFLQAALEQQPEARVQCARHGVPVGLVLQDCSQRIGHRLARRTRHARSASRKAHIRVPTHPLEPVDRPVHAPARDSCTRGVPRK